MSLEQEIAKVMSVNGQYAFLRTKNKNACGECASKGSCGSMKLFETHNDEAHNIRVKNSLNLQVGDNVVLELSATKLLQGTFLIYLLPLFSLFFFAGLGKVMGGEAISVLSGLSGLFVALFFVKRFVSRSDVSDQFVPRVTQKIIDVNIADNI